MRPAGALRGPLPLRQAPRNQLPTCSEHSVTVSGIRGQSGTAQCHWQKASEVSTDRECLLAEGLGRLEDDAGLGNIGQDSLSDLKPCRAECVKDLVGNTVGSGQ